MLSAPHPPTTRSRPRGRRSGSALALAVTVCLISPLAAPPTAAAEGSDPRAVEIADRVLTALGGEEAWQQTRYLRFRFFGRRDHLWDRFTGRHRLEGETRDGKHYVVLHNIHDQGEGEGKVTLDGQEAPEEQRRQMLQNAYAAWINDTYWLLMPYKLRDPGVQLTWAGEETTSDGEVYDKLQLAFQGVGLTPGDRYWAYIDRQTSLMDRWAYILQDQDPEGPATEWRWEGWQRYGRILLAPTRRQVGGEERVLSLAPIEVPETVDETLFTQP